MKWLDTERIICIAEGARSKYFFKCKFIYYLNTYIQP